MRKISMLLIVMLLISGIPLLSLNGECQDESNLSVQLKFSHSYALEGAEVTVSAIINNTGSAAAYNVTVVFYLDGDEIGRKVIESINSNDSAFTSISWTAVKGVHKFTVKIDGTDISDTETFRVNVPKEEEPPFEEHIFYAAIVVLLILCLALIIWKYKKQK